MTRRTPWTAVVTAVTVSAGLLFGISATASKGNDLRPGQRDMAQVVQAANQRVARQSATVKSLQSQVDSLSKTSGGSNNAATIAAKADALAPKAGFTAVTGSTVTVTLDDSKRDPSTLPEGGNLNWLVVHQQDVQAVVNALWRGGATAMMLMDQRVISTSAVRCVGNTLILQGRVYSPPFKITAMGDTTELKLALENDAGVTNYRSYVDLVGLGYDVKTSASQTFPAFGGSSTLRYAKAAFSSSAPSSPASGASATSSSAPSSSAK
ncbi:DUF881 domain-containing protein [Yimella sp. cx-51]|uniref:DUF881 domain-containing protein n=1 Tax=Yimella sp. cx-51 TaxID=2770551 RepID=UPI00165E5E28|nr:DUF881 domain-containing protein [Yimella sp. cx-51]MBC9958038.1 DUF881 domain-containing protein [Yimella sp. cx-51]QTH38158.1 DUF881 domain-containing protein [Yimella sp. cx-51]